jgi:hypothetical protein
MLATLRSSANLLATFGFDANTFQNLESGERLANTEY